MQILLVEDEKRLADALGRILENEKYGVDIVGNGLDGLAYAQTGHYDAVVLDVMLPGMNGFDVVSQMRREKIATPVLLLTARDELGDKITGLDSGADDYLTKPFASEELLARLRALTRRLGEVCVEKLSFGDLTLNLSTYDLVCGVKSLHLGYKEFEVLRILLSNPNIVVPKETLIAKVWGYDSEAEDNNVEAYISFLRKKFFFLGTKASIETLRKVGYKLEYKAE